MGISRGNLFSRLAALLSGGVMGLSCAVDFNNPVSSTDPAADPTPTASPSASSVPEISRWDFVDGNGANGWNWNTARTAGWPRITAFNSKLYVAWHELNNGAYQIRFAVYNGNDSSPSRSWVDGGGVTGTGINYATGRQASLPQMTVFNSKLYLTWSEDNPNATQIRVAVYNGDDSSPARTLLDGGSDNGINKNALRIAVTPQLTVFNSKLYATWTESTAGANQIRVAVYNGNDGAPSWAFVDGNGVNGINKDATINAGASQLTVFNSKLYAIWGEKGAIEQIRVAVYNGNDSSPGWSFVDGNGAVGINKSSLRDASDAQLIVLDSKLYAAWSETNGTTNQIRVVVYNGNDSSPSWTFIDGNGTSGINKDSSRNAYFPNLAVFNSKLYATWYEANSSAVYQTRVAVYNGNDSSPSWSFIDGNGANGVNKDPTRGAGGPAFMVFNSKLYLTWYEENASLVEQIRMAVGIAP